MSANRRKRMLRRFWAGSYPHWRVTGFGTPQTISSMNLNDCLSRRDTRRQSVGSSPAAPSPAFEDVAAHASAARMRCRRLISN